MPKYLNRFSSPTFIEETILDADSTIVGTVRIKPSSVMWRPKGSHSFFSVPLDRFAAWITDVGTAAKKLKS